MSSPSWGLEQRRARSCSASRGSRPTRAHVARAISVLGDGAELSVVAELAELELSTAAAATRELVHAEILRPEPPLGFVHALVQAAVYHDLAPGERELYHERAAAVLIRVGAPQEQVAAHLLVKPARGQDWVVDLLRETASTALAKGDPDSAISSLRRALDEPPAPDVRLDVLLELGAAETMTSIPACGRAFAQRLRARTGAVREGRGGRPARAHVDVPERARPGAAIARRAAPGAPRGAR